MAFFEKIKKSDLAKCNLCKSGLELKICSLCVKPFCSEHYNTSAIGICWCKECIERVKEKDIGYLPMI